jgi:flagellar biosynthesis protein FlhB
MSRVWKKVEHYITPTKENTYRPHVLQKTWLVFFLALSLTLEGFLVSSMVARQTDSFITRAPLSEQSAAVLSMQTAQSVVRELVRIFSDPRVANTVLALVGAFVLVVVVLTFVMHIEVQSHETLAAGLVIAAIAFVCLAANMHYLTSSSDVAAGINALAP